MGNEEKNCDQMKENLGNVGNDEQESRKRKKDNEDNVPTKKAKLDEVESLAESKIKKKKKSRTRKDSGMDSATVNSEGTTSGLKILSKVEWKKLRNQYLNLQRKNMKLAKSKLRKQAYHKGPGRPGQVKSKEIPNDQDQHGGETKDGQDTTLDMKPNLIVKITIEDGVDDVKKLKKNVRDLLSGEAVGYVDAKIGAKVAYVRCKEEAQASKLVSTGKDYERLQGEEENKYWAKIQQDRCDKREGKVKIPKEKKKNKIIREIETAKASHTYFPE